MSHREHAPKRYKLGRGDHVFQVLLLIETQRRGLRDQSSDVRL